MVHVGNNNFVNGSKILTVSTLKAISVRRIVKQAENDGLLLDFTGALPTKGIIIMDNGVLIRTPLRPVDLQRAINSLDKVIQLGAE